MTHSLADKGQRQCSITVLANICSTRGAEMKHKKVRTMPELASERRIVRMCSQLARTEPNGLLI
jgi:hypothetical protein